MLKRLLRRVRTTDTPTLSSLRAYALWAHDYPPHAHNALMQAEEAAMLGLLPGLSGKTVLDLACGSGRYARIAGEQAARQVIAIDNSLHMLQTGQAALDRHDFIQGDSLHVPLKGGSVDVLLCGLAIGHLSELDPAIAEISRVLRTGGVALISDFHPFLFLDGKQRTFTAPDGGTYAVEHHAHLYSDLHAAAQRNRLTIDAIREPRLEIDGHTVPAVIVYRMLKSAP